MDDRIAIAGRRFAPNRARRLRAFAVLAGLLYVVATLALRFMLARIDWAFVSTLETPLEWTFLLAAGSLAALYGLWRAQGARRLAPALAAALLLLGLYSLSLRRVEFRPADGALTEYWLAGRLARTTLPGVDDLPWCHRAGFWNLSLHAPGRPPVRAFRWSWPRPFWAVSLRRFAFPGCGAGDGGAG